MAAIGRLKQRAIDRECEEKLWPTVRFTIDDLYPDVIKLKHQVEDNSKCKGNVEDGQCNRCHANVPGILAYSFTFTAQDKTHTGCELVVSVSDKGGRALFQKSPEAFRMMNTTEKAQAIEKVEVVPVAAKLIITYNPSTEDLFISAFNFAMISDA